MIVWCIIFIVLSLLIGENKTDDLGYDTWLIGGYLVHKHFSS